MGAIHRAGAHRSTDFPVRLWLSEKAGRTGKSVLRYFLHVHFALSSHAFGAEEETERVCGGFGETVLPNYSDVK